MTDPLSIASGVAGLLSLGISVSQGIITYYSSWKDCPENVTSTVQALNSLSNILKNIKRSTDESSQLQLETREAIDNSVLSCRAVLEKLEKKLEKPKQPGNDPRRWGKVAGAMQRGIYPFKESTLAKLREHVSELRASLNLALSDANLELSSSTSITVASLQHSEDEKRRQEILDWLSNDDSAEQQQSILEKREDGTGLWFTSSDEFTKWSTSTGSDRVLFCPGDPGTGKSFITCHAVDHLRSTTLSGRVGKPCVFYCDYKKRDQQTVPFATLSILRQLVAFLDQIPLTVGNHYDRCQRSKCHLTQSECMDLLKEMRALIDGVQIVVDALDEFSTQENARNRFCGFLLYLTGMLDAKLMITTRNIEDISRHFEGKLRCEIKASNEDVDKFLRSYLRDKCGNPVITEDPDLQKEIRSAIMAQIDGMFLLAKLQVESLVDKVSKKKVRQALTHLSAGPEGLQRAYEKAVAQVGSQRTDHLDLARKTIAWITLSRRPLSMKELQHAIAAIDAKDNEPYEDSISPQNLVTSVCAGLVVHDVTTNSVRFVHTTTQEFFEGHLESWVEDAKAMIARACFTYASYAAEVHIQAFQALYAQGRQSYDAFSDALYETWGNNNMLYSFLKYAATYAGTHATDEPSGEWYGLALSILLEPTKSWIILKCFEDVEDYKLDLRGFPSCNGSSIHGLNLAIRFNLPETVESLLEHGVPLFPVNRVESPPLNEAIRYGRFDIVQKLVKAGAQDVARENASHGFEEPLYVAAEHDRAGRFVSLLLENDRMDIDTTNGVRQTALGVAASEGNINVVKLLLELRDVFADSKNWFGETPFMMAAERGKADVVQLFLERADVDPYTVNNIRQDAILGATRNSRAPVCKLLIERHIQDGILRSRIENGPRLSGAGDRLNRAASSSPISKPDDKNRDELGFNLLCLFGTRGDIGTMSTLLNHGVDVVLGTFESPLLSESYRPDHSEVIDFLLERGAELDATCRSGGATLHYAICDGNTDLAEEMIARGANVNLEWEDDEGNTPLMLAARFEQIETIGLLLSKGAVVNYCDKNGFTALAYAVEGENLDEDVVSLLLEHGANIDGSAPSGQTRFSTPLIRAAEHGRAYGVRLLLEHGCKVDLCDSDGNTALAWAARVGKLDTVLLLVEHNADVNTANKDGTTPLMHAIDGRLRVKWRASIFDVVQELLKCGAKIDARNTTGLTALHMATRAPLGDDDGIWNPLDDIDLLNTLVEHGMDVNVVDDTGRTPLMLAAQHGKKSRTQFLLEHGAQIDQRDLEGRDACAWAEANDKLEIAEMLRNAAAEA